MIHWSESLVTHGIRPWRWKMGNRQLWNGDRFSTWHHHYFWQETYPANVLTTVLLRGTRLGRGQVGTQMHPIYLSSVNGFEGVSLTLSWASSTMLRGNIFQMAQVFDCENRSLCIVKQVSIACKIINKCSVNSVRHYLRPLWRNIYLVSRNLTRYLAVEGCITIEYMISWLVANQGCMADFN